MKVLAAHIYPDLSGKRKHNDITMKKHCKGTEESFEKYLQSFANQLRGSNNKSKKNISNPYTMLLNKSTLL